LLAASFAQLHALFKQLQRAFERQFTAFHFFYNRFQLRQAGFKTAGDRFIGGGLLCFGIGHRFSL
jgi:hypothetical protein